MSLLVGWRSCCVWEGAPGLVKGFTRRVAIHFRRRPAILLPPGGLVTIEGRMPATTPARRTVMPLLDHFQAPLYPLFHWESFHSHWASILTNQLNGGVLPPEYVAAPHVKMGTDVEIDVGTLELYEGSEGQGGAATAVYAPPSPALSIPIAFPTLDLFEILIRPEGSARLAAAIEFVSPANKDRPASRRAFAIKCASYLQEGAALVVADIVTNRKGYLPQA